MGKQLNLLRKLIKEELEIALTEDDLTVHKSTDTIKAGADYDQLEESEDLNEAAMEDIVDYLIDEDLTEEEEIDEARGRKAGSGKVFTLKGGQKIEDVKSFLTKVQSLIATKKGRGRKGMNFTDADIDAFAELLTRPEGFTRKDILSTISFYEGKPFQAAQKMMDILGEPKLTDKIDKEGERVSIGKGYIEVLEKEDEEVENTDTEDIEEDEFEDAKDGKIDGPTDDELAKVEDELEDYIDLNENTVRMFQKRAGLLNG